MRPTRRLFGQAYIAADETVDRARLRRVLDELAALTGRDGYFTEAFCREARYFQPHNGRRIDAIRDAIDELELSPVERGIVLTSLLEAADRVDSTTGLQMAFLKGWAPRSFSSSSCASPSRSTGRPGASRARRERARAGELEVDLVYLDPPYNGHSYFSNYHVWETIVRWDAPERYGIANKRVDCRERKSAYNSKRVAAGDARRPDRPSAGALAARLGQRRGLPLGVEHPRAARRGRATSRRIDVDAKRYVGAQIGIHNPSGEKVGRVSHLRNREHLFLAGPDRRVVEDAASQLAAAHG